MDTKIYAKTIEPEAVDQIYKMARSEAYDGCKIRIMPDCHAGKGCTVGTVIKIKDKVVPNTVGVDIGCGMLVCYLGKIHIDLERLDEVINEKVPYGFASHEIPVANFYDLTKLRCGCYIKSLDCAYRQIGTLGGGNHFIELNVDEDGCKYLVIHSGSRHLGVEVCKHYQEIAYDNLRYEVAGLKRLLVNRLKAEGRAKDIESEWNKIPKPPCDKDLAYIDGENLEDYLHDMSIVQAYASFNRMQIARIILDTMGIEVVSLFETIHNYVDVKEGVVRKGAVRAKKGDVLVIPINMRDGSLICVGKGNDDWLCSAPHGAGRLLSRSKAKSTLSMDDFKESMKDVYSTSICESTIDEAPMAYKPMQEIIECIEPTVDVVKIIKPIYNFKAK